MFDLRVEARARWNREMVPLRISALTFVAIGGFGVYEGLQIWIVGGDATIGAFLVVSGIFFAGSLGGVYLYVRRVQIISLTLDPSSIRLTQLNGTARVFSFAQPGFRIGLQDRSNWKVPSMLFTGNFSIYVVGRGMVTAPIPAEAFASLKAAIEGHGVALERVDREFGSKPGDQPTVTYYAPARGP